MYVNLHTLPADQGMYTLFIADEDYADVDNALVEELDIVAAAGLGPDEVVEAARAELTRAYEHGWVIGIVEQSAGYVVYDVRNHEERGHAF